MADAVALPDEGTQLLPSVPKEKLGQELALNQLSTLPELPNEDVGDYRLEQHEYAMHLDSAMLTYTPVAGKLKHTEPQANRFDDIKSTKRKIFVNKEVLGRLVCVAEELNKAQAQIEIRKIIKREQKRVISEAPVLEALQDPVTDGDPIGLADLLTGLETEDGTPSESPAPTTQARASRASKRVPSAYRLAQVRYPAVLASTAPKDRWGYFRALQRLYPAANAVRPGHIAFGTAVPPPPPPPPQQQHSHQSVTGAAAVKAAKALQREADRQAEAVVAAESSSTVPPAMIHMDSAVEAVMRANEVREARRALARQIAEEEGLPVETWWDIMQKRKKMAYFTKLLEEMAGRMDILRLHRAARVIQKAWRIHRRLRTRKASEEIALLQKELAQRRAMEAALRAAAEAAIREQQERERLRRKPPRVARISISAPDGGDQETMRGSNSGGPTFSRAASARNLNWQASLRSSIPASLSRSISRNFSRSPSQRRKNAEPPAEPESEEDESAMPYQRAQNSLWAKIQALIGTDWDVDDTSSSSSSAAEEPAEEEEDEDDDGDEGSGDETEHERRLRLRRERNEVRKARKAAAEADAAATAEEAGTRRRRKKGKKASDASEGDGTMMARVVKQAVAAAKAMAKAEAKKPKRHPRKALRAAFTGNIDMRMLAQAAASLGMSIEAYISMRNRKLGLIGPEEWTPPPLPEGNLEDLVGEEEMKRLEEEARRELMQKAAQEYVARATAAARAAAAAAQLAAKQAAAGGEATGADGGPFASSAAVALVNQAARDGMAATTSATRSRLPPGPVPGDGQPGGPPLLPLDGADISAEEAAAAFAAAAAPALSIEDNDVWSLVKEKVRLRLALKQLESSGNAEALMEAVENDINGWDDEDEEDEGAGAEGEDDAEADEDEDEDGEDDEEEDEEDEEGEQQEDDGDWPDGWGSEPSSESSAPRRRRRRRRRQRSSSQAGAHGSSAPLSLKARRGGRKGATGGSSAATGRSKSDSEYDTMSEDEIQRAGPATLKRIGRAKAKAKAFKDLRGYYARRLRAKRAAAAAAEAAMREERVKAQRSAPLTGLSLGPRVLVGPAWRPGGGALLRRRPAESFTTGRRRGQPPPPPVKNFIATPYRRPPPPPPRVAERLAMAMAMRSVLAGGSSRNVLRAASPRAPRVPRTEPYQFSPGGPSLLYRQRPSQTKQRRTLERTSVRRAVWEKGADMPGAVFTQFGWVPASSLVAAQQAEEEAAAAADPLTAQLATLGIAGLTPALEAFCKQLGLGRDLTSSSGLPTVGGPLMSTSQATLHPVPSSLLERPAPASGGASRGVMSVGGGSFFSVRGAAPAARPSSHPVARTHPAAAAAAASVVPKAAAGVASGGASGPLVVAGAPVIGVTGAGAVTAAGVGPGSFNVLGHRSAPLLITPAGPPAGQAPSGQSHGGAAAHGRGAQGPAAPAQPGHSSAPQATQTPQTLKSPVTSVVHRQGSAGSLGQALTAQGQAAGQGSPVLISALLPHPPGQPPIVRGLRGPVLRNSSAFAAYGGGGAAKASDAEGGGGDGGGGAAGDGSFGVAAEGSVGGLVGLPGTRLSIVRARSHGDTPLSRLASDASLPVSRGGSDTVVAVGSRAGLVRREAPPPSQRAAAAAQGSAAVPPAAAAPASHGAAARGSSAAAAAAGSGPKPGVLAVFGAAPRGEGLGAVQGRVAPKAPPGLGAGGSAGVGAAAPAKAPVAGAASSSQGHRGAVSQPLEAAPPHGAARRPSGSGTAVGQEQVVAPAASSPGAAWAAAQTRDDSGAGPVVLAGGQHLERAESGPLLLEEVGPYREHHYGPGVDDSGVPGDGRGGEGSLPATDTGTGTGTGSEPGPRGRVSGAAGEVPGQLQGHAFQVALAVLKSNTVKPAVARRLFPLGRAHVMDSLPLPALSGAAAMGSGAGTGAGDVPPGAGPLSFPLDDISSSYSSSDDLSGWSTASEDLGEEVDGEEPPALSAALSARVAAAAAKGGGRGAPPARDQGVGVGHPMARGRPGAAGSGGGRVMSPRTARAALAAASVMAPGGVAPSVPDSSGSSEALAAAAVQPPSVGPAWASTTGASAAAAAAAGRGTSTQGHTQPPASAAAGDGVGAVAGGAAAAPSAPLRPLKASGYRTSPAPSAPEPLLSSAAVMQRGGARAVPPRTDSTAGNVHAGGPLSVALPDDGYAGLVAAATDLAVPPVEEAEALEDEEDARQFDMLYDMTRMAIAPPPTPRDYSPDADLIRITIRRSEAAKQRAEEEKREQRRARLLGPYAAMYARSLGHAYERAQYRRRQARALAALAKANSPAGVHLRGRTFRGGVRGTSLAGRLPVLAAAGLGGAVRGSGSGDGAAASGRRPPRTKYPAGFGGRGSVEAVEGSAASRTLRQVRVRAAAGCVSGFGASYYWRQPVRLGSLIRIKPARAQSPLGSSPRVPEAAAPSPSLPAGVEAPPSPLPEGAAAAAETALLRDRRASVPGALGLAALPTPAEEAAEVTEIASTALKLLSELGSEIGRMEEQIQALQRKAELEREQEKQAARSQQQHQPAEGALQQQQQQPPHKPPPPGPVYRPQALPRAASQLQTPRNRLALAHPQRTLQALPLLLPPAGILGTSLRVPFPPQQLGAAVSAGAAAGAAAPRSSGSRTGGSSGATPSSPLAGSPGAGGGGAGVMMSFHGRHASAAAHHIASGAVRNSAALTARIAQPVRRSADGDSDSSGPEGGGGGAVGGSPPHSRSAPLVRLPLGATSGGGLLSGPDQLEVRPTSSFGTAAGTAAAAAAAASAAAASAVGGEHGGDPAASSPLLDRSERSWSPSGGAGAARRGVSPRTQLLPTTHGAAAAAAAAATHSAAAGVASARFGAPHSGFARTAGNAAPSASPWEAAADYDVVMLAGVSSPLVAAALTMNGNRVLGPGPGPGQQLHYTAVPSTAPALLPNISGGSSGNGPLGIVGLRPSSSGWPGSVASGVALGGGLPGGRAVSPSQPHHPPHASQLLRQASEGRELPLHSPLAAWAAPPPSVLPDITQAPNSPTKLHTVSLNPGAAPITRQMTPTLNSTRALQQLPQPAYQSSQSPPHSPNPNPNPNPYRNYPKMELGLGASGNAAGRARRRGSFEGPAAQYYVPSGGTGTFASHDMYEGFSPRCGNAMGISVDSLLLNMSLLNGKGGGGGSGGGPFDGSGGTGGMTERAQQRAGAAAAAAAVASRQPRAPDVLTVAATVLGEPAGPSGGSGGSGGLGPRFTRVRRLSVGPYPAGA